MAYTPINWQTGDTITATKLNKCDNGWSVETTSTTSFSGSVTTADDGYGSFSGTLVGSPQITVESIIVTCNGTEYNCTGRYNGNDEYWEYGAPWSDDLGKYDFSTYPFNIYSDAYDTLLYTETAGTYTLKIETSSTTIEISDNFQSAVNTATLDIAPLIVVAGTTTWQEAHDAVVNGRSVYYFEDTGTSTIIRDVAVRVSEFTVAFITVFGSSFTLTTLSASSADGVLTAS